MRMSLPAAATASLGQNISTIPNDEHDLTKGAQTV